MSETNEVVKSEVKLPASLAQNPLLAEFGDLLDETQVDQKDVVIPRLRLMQSTSEAVKEEKARAGEVWNTEGKKVCDKGAALEFIPVHSFKSWVTVKKAGNEYVKEEPLTLANAKTPREEILADGTEVVNYEQINYLVLLPVEVARGVFTPYILSFRSTSYFAGKLLETHRNKLLQFKIPIAFKTFKLGTELRKNDHGSFYVYTVEEARDTLEEELIRVKELKYAIDAIKAGKAVIHDDDLGTKAGGEGPAADARSGAASGPVVEPGAAY